MEDREPEGAESSLDDRGKRTLTHVIYGLQAAFIVNGVSLLLGVVLNYVKRREMRGTLYESHFRHQIGTFWIGLGGIVLILIIGFGIIFPQIRRGLGTEPAIGAAGAVLLGSLPVALAIYLYFRIVRGWLALLEERPIDEVRGPSGDTR